jgi:hypothetical protein
VAAVVTGADPHVQAMSRRLIRFVPLAVLPLAVACGYGDHHHDHDGYYGDGYTSSPSSGTVEQATIDADEVLDVKPNEIPGVFIEYASGGTYQVTTSCNSDVGDCSWDIIVTPLGDGTLKKVSPVDLESDDSLALNSDQARLVANTGRDFDGFTLETDPGAGIRLDALLDGGDANPFFYWVGDGALHSGAPSNPIDLVPSGN